MVQIAVINKKHITIIVCEKGVEDLKIINAAENNLTFQLDNSL